MFNQPSGDSRIILAEKAQNEHDPYQLSMAVLALGLNANKAFEKYSGSFLDLIEACPKGNGFKAWMCGRLLLGGQAVKQWEVIQKTLALLQRLLGDETQMKQCLQDPDQGAFYAWAIGYLASYYAEEKQHDLANALIQRLLEIAIPSQIEKLDDPNNLCNLLWTYAMTMLAITTLKDQGQYFSLLENIAQQFALEPHSKKLAEVVFELLSHKIAPNDYKAWLLSIFFNAAQQFHLDTPPINRIMQTALTGAAKAYPYDRMMAEATLKAGVSSDCNSSPLSSPGHRSS